MQNTIYCPGCGTRKEDSEARFCTGCGIDLKGVGFFVDSRGGEPVTSLKGVRQGTRLILLGLLLIPVWLFIGAAFPPNDRLVEGAPSTTPAEAIAWIMMWMAFIAGAGRIAWATIFEADCDPAGTSTSRLKRRFSRKEAHKGLPSAARFEAARPGAWRSSGDLFQPAASRARGSGEL